MPWDEVSKLSFVVLTVMQGAACAALLHVRSQTKRIDPVYVRRTRWRTVAVLAVNLGVAVWRTVWQVY